MSVKGEIILVSFAWLLGSHYLDNSGQVGSGSENFNYYYLSRISMKSFYLFLVLSFSLIGCDDKDQEKLEGNNQLLCGDQKTMLFGESINTMDWKIALKSSGFNQNVSFFINEQLVFSECSENPGIATLNRNRNPAIIVIPKYWSVADGATVSAKITDCFSGVVKYLNPVQKVSTPAVDTCKYALIEI